MDYWKIVFPFEVEIGDELYGTEVNSTPTNVILVSCGRVITKQFEESQAMFEVLTKHPIIYLKHYYGLDEHVIIRRNDSCVY